MLFPTPGFAKYSCVDNSPHLFDFKLCAHTTEKHSIITLINLWHLFWSILKACKSLHSRKSFVLGELSFARMPSRQYCLKVNKLHCWNCRPELVNCGQWQPWGVVTQHGKTQILGLPKLLQKLIPPHICRNWTFLRIQNLGLSILGQHTSWLSLAAMD